MKRLIFLDRDGVINKNIEGGYVLGIPQFEWLPGVFEALKELNQPDYRICVVTNQAAVHKGLLKEPDLKAIHSFMLDTVRRNQGRIDAVLYCPHTGDERCACRKPEAGMLKQGMEQFKSFEERWMVGDSMDDMLAGRRAGCKTILVQSPRTLRELRSDPGRIALADYYVLSLLEAAQIIQK